MLNERILELIQADTDGMLTGQEKSELEAVLAQSAEARQIHDEMVRIDRMISSLPPVEPPAGLTSRILQSIHLPAKPRFAGLSSWFDRSWFVPASYGLAVAAGVMVVVGVVQMAPQSQEDMSRLVGTMVSSGPQSTQPVSGELEIDLSHVQGHVKLKHSDQALALEFDLSSESEVEVSVNLVDSGLEFGGFARQDGSLNLENIEVSEEKVMVSNRGDHQFVVFLRHNGSSGKGLTGIGIAVSQGGTVVYQGLLESKG